MTINIKKYVEITSGVGGGQGVRQRELIGMIFTDNPRVNPDEVIEFTTASDVVAYFGVGTPEALRAAFYFDFISKSISSPEKIAFVRYASTVQPPRVYGAPTIATILNWQGITSGALTLTFGADTAVLTGLDFSTVVALADVATVIQTALRATAGAQFATALVTYDPARRAFNIVGSVSEDANVELGVPVVGFNIAPMLGLGSINSIFSDGVSGETATEAFLRAADRNNNFGSFLYLPTLTLEQVAEIAVLNSGRNVEFMYAVAVSGDEATLTLWSETLLPLSGVALTYAPTAGQYDEMAPMILLAATDYERRNSVQNYMFNQFALTPKVDANGFSDTLDNLRINYIGVTQTAGQLLAFYQRGVMTGGATAPVDMNTYANEMWLKDAAAAALMSLLLSVPRVPANIEGRGQVITILQDAIDRALFNGVISIGKTLSTVQRLYVTQVSGVEDAWYQVQSIGYWLDCGIESYTTTDGRTEYKAVYTLIYSKDDAIRKVEGTHILI